MNIRVLALSLLLFWGIVAPAFANDETITKAKAIHVKEEGVNENAVVPSLQKATSRPSNDGGRKNIGAIVDDLTAQNMQPAEEASSGTDWGGLNRNSQSEMESVRRQKRQQSTDEKTSLRQKRAISTNTNAMRKVMKSGQATVAETLNGGAAIQRILAQAEAETNKVKADLYKKKFRSNLFKNDFDDWMVLGSGRDIFGNVFSTPHRSRLRSHVRPANSYYESSTFYDDFDGSNESDSENDQIENFEIMNVGHRGYHGANRNFDRLKFNQQGQPYNQQWHRPHFYDYSNNNGYRGRFGPMMWKGSTETNQYNRAHRNKESVELNRIQNEHSSIKEATRGEDQYDLMAENTNIRNMKTTAHADNKNVINYGWSPNENHKVDTLSSNFNDDINVRNTVFTNSKNKQIQRSNMPLFARGKINGAENKQWRNWNAVDSSTNEIADNGKGGAQERWVSFKNGRQWNNGGGTVGNAIWQEEDRTVLTNDQENDDSKKDWRLRQNGVEHGKIRRLDKTNTNDVVFVGAEGEGYASKSLENPSASTQVIVSTNTNVGVGKHTGAAEISSHAQAAENKYNDAAEHIEYARANYHEHSAAKSTSVVNGRVVDDAQQRNGAVGIAKNGKNANYQNYNDMMGNFGNRNKKGRNRDIVGKHLSDGGILLNTPRRNFNTKFKHLFSNGELTAANDVEELSSEEGTPGFYNFFAEDSNEPRQRYRIKTRRPPDTTEKDIEFNWMSDESDSGELISYMDIYPEYDGDESEFVVFVPDPETLGKKLRNRDKVTNQRAFLRRKQELEENNQSVRRSDSKVESRFLLDNKDNIGGRVTSRGRGNYRLIDGAPANWKESDTGDFDIVTERRAADTSVEGFQKNHLGQDINVDNTGRRRASKVLDVSSADIASTTAAVKSFEERKQEKLRTDNAERIHQSEELFGVDFIGNARDGVNNDEMYNLEDLAVEDSRRPFRKYHQASQLRNNQWKELSIEEDIETGASNIDVIETTLVLDDSAEAIIATSTTKQNRTKASLELQSDEIDENTEEKSDEQISSEGFAMGVGKGIEDTSNSVETSKVKAGTRGTQTSALMNNEYVYSEAVGADEIDETLLTTESYASDVASAAVDRSSNSENKDAWTFTTAKYTSEEEEMKENESLDKSAEVLDNGTEGLGLSRSSQSRILSSTLDENTSQVEEAVETIIESGIESSEEGSLDKSIVHGHIGGKGKMSHRQEHSENIGDGIYREDMEVQTVEEALDKSVRKTSMAEVKSSSESQETSENSSLSVITKAAIALKDDKIENEIKEERSEAPSAKIVFFESSTNAADNVHTEGNAALTNEISLVSSSTEVSGAGLDSYDATNTRKVASSRKHLIRDDQHRYEDERSGNDGSSESGGFTTTSMAVLKSDTSEEQERSSVSAETFIGAENVETEKGILATHRRDESINEISTNTKATSTVDSTIDNESSTSSYETEKQSKNTENGKIEIKREKSWEDSIKNSHTHEGYNSETRKESIENVARSVGNSAVVSAMSAEESVENVAADSLETSREYHAKRKKVMGRERNNEDIIREKIVNQEEEDMSSIGLSVASSHSNKERNYGKNTGRVRTGEKSIGRTIAALASNEENNSLRQTEATASTVAEAEVYRTEDKRGWHERKRNKEKLSDINSTDRTAITVNEDSDSTEASVKQSNINDERNALIETIATSASFDQENLEGSSKVGSTYLEESKESSWGSITLDGNTNSLATSKGFSKVLAGNTLNVEISKRHGLETKQSRGESPVSSERHREDALIFGEELSNEVSLLKRDRHFKAEDDREDLLATDRNLVHGAERIVDSSEELDLGSGLVTTGNAVYTPPRKKAKDISRVAHRLLNIFNEDLAENNSSDEENAAEDLATDSTIVDTRTEDNTKKIDRGAGIRNLRADLSKLVDLVSDESYNQEDASTLRNNVFQELLEEEKKHRINKERASEAIEEATGSTFTEVDTTLSNGNEGMDIERSVKASTDQSSGEIHEENPLTIKSESSKELSEERRAHHISSEENASAERLASVKVHSTTTASEEASAEATLMSAETADADSSASIEVYEENDPSVRYSQVADNVSEETEVYHDEKGTTDETAAFSSIETKVLNVIETENKVKDKSRITDRLVTLQDKPSTLKSLTSKEDSRQMEDLNREEHISSNVSDFTSSQSESNLERFTEITQALNSEILSEGKATVGTELETIAKIESQQAEDVSSAAELVHQLSQERKGHSINTEEGREVKASATAQAFADVSKEADEVNSRSTLIASKTPSFSSTENHQYERNNNKESNEEYESALENLELQSLTSLLVETMDSEYIKEISEEVNMASKETPQYEIEADTSTERIQEDVSALESQISKKESHETKIYERQAEMRKILETLDTISLVEDDDDDNIIEIGIKSLSPLEEINDSSGRYTNGEDTIDEVLNGASASAETETSFKGTTKVGSEAYNAGSNLGTIRKEPEENLLNESYTEKDIAITSEASRALSDEEEVYSADSLSSTETATIGHSAQPSKQINKDDEVANTLTNIEEDSYASVTTGAHADSEVSTATSGLSKESSEELQQHAGTKEQSVAAFATASATAVTSMHSAKMREVHDELHSDSKLTTDDMYHTTSLKTEQENDDQITATKESYEISNDQKLHLEENNRETQHLTSSSVETKRLQVEETWDDVETKATVKDKSEASAHRLEIQSLLESKEELEEQARDFIIDKKNINVDMSSLASAEAEINGTSSSDEIGLVSQELDIGNRAESLTSGLNSAVSAEFNHDKSISLISNEASHKKQEHVSIEGNKYAEASAVTSTKTETDLVDSAVLSEEVRETNIERNLVTGKVQASTSIESDPRENVSELSLERFRNQPGQKHCHNFNCTASKEILRDKLTVLGDRLNTLKSALSAENPGKHKAYLIQAKDLDISTDPMDQIETEGDIRHRAAALARKLTSENSFKLDAGEQSSMSEEYLEESRQKKQHYLNALQKILEGLTAASTAVDTAVRVSDIPEKNSNASDIHRNRLNIGARFDPIISSQEETRLLPTDDITTGISSELDLGSTLVTTGSKVYQAMDAKTHQDIDGSGLKSEISQDVLHERHPVAEEDSVEMVTSSSISAKSILAKSLDASKESYKELDIRNELTHAEGIASAVISAEEDVSALKSELSYGNSREKKEHHISLEKDTELDSSEDASAEVDSTSMQSSARSRVTSEGVNPAIELTLVAARQHAIASSKAQLEDLSSLTSELSQDTSHEKVIHLVSTQKDTQLEKSVFSDSAEMITGKVESTGASEEISNELNIKEKSAHTTAEAHTISSSQSNHDENTSVLQSESSSDISRKPKHHYASLEEDIELQTAASSLTEVYSSAEQSFDASKEITTEFDTENNRRIISTKSDEQEDLSVFNSKTSHVISQEEDRQHFSKERGTISSAGTASTDRDWEKEILASEHLESEQDMQVQTTSSSSVEIDSSMLQSVDTSNGNMEKDITGNLEQFEDKTHLSLIEAQKAVSNSEFKLSHERSRGNERYRTIENNIDAGVIASTEVDIGLADLEDASWKMSNELDTESKQTQSGFEAYVIPSTNQEEYTSSLESKASHQESHQESARRTVNTELESTEGDFDLDYSTGTSTEINEQLGEESKLIPSEIKNHVITSTAPVEVDHANTMQSAGATNKMSEDLNVGSATREKIKSQIIGSTKVEYTDVSDSESSNIALINDDKATELDATAVGSTEAHATSAFLTDTAEEITEDLDTWSQLEHTQGTDDSSIKSDFSHEMFGERKRYYPNSERDTEVQEIDVASDGEDNFIGKGGITNLISEELDTAGRLTDAEPHRLTSIETHQENDISDEETEISEEIVHERKGETDVSHSLDGMKEISEELDVERNLFDIAKTYVIPRSESLHLEDESALKLGSYEHRTSQGQTGKVKGLGSMEMEDFVSSLSMPEEATKKVDIGNQLASVVTEADTVGASEMDVHNTHEEDTIEDSTNHHPSLLFHGKYKPTPLPKVSLEDIQTEENGDTLLPIESSRPLYLDDPIDTEDVWDLARGHIRTPNIPALSNPRTHFSDEILKDIHTTTTVNPQGDTTTALIFQADNAGGSIEDHSLLSDTNFADSSNEVRLKENRIEMELESFKSQSSEQALHEQDVINATEETIIDSSLSKAISVSDSSEVDAERDETVEISDSTRIATLAATEKTHLHNISIGDTSETDMAASAESTASTIDQKVDEVYRTSHENLSSISTALIEGKPSKYLIQATIEELNTVVADAALEESIENDYEEHVSSHEHKFTSRQESDNRRIPTNERNKEYGAHISHGKIDDAKELLSHEVEKDIGIEETSVEATSEIKDIHQESHNSDNELFEDRQIKKENRRNKMPLEEMEILSDNEENRSIDVSLSTLTNNDSGHYVKELADVTREVSDEFGSDFSEAVSDAHTVSTSSREDGISVKAGERFGDTKIEGNHRESYNSSDEQLVDKSIWSSGIADVSASADAITHTEEENDQTEEITDEQKSNTAGVEIDIDGSASEITKASKEKLHSFAEEVETSNERFLDGSRSSEIAAIDIGNARSESPASLDAFAELETSLTEENWSSEGISKERNEIDGSRQIETESIDSINPYPDDWISNKDNEAISPLSTIGGDSNEANKHPTEYLPWFDTIEEEELDNDDLLTPPKLALVPTKRGILLLPLTMEASAAADASDAPELAPISTEPTEAGSGEPDDRSAGHLYPPTFIRPFDYSKTDIYIVRRASRGPVRITHMNDGIPPLVSFRLVPREVYEQVRNIIGQHRLSYNAYPVGASPIHL